MIYRFLIILVILVDLNAEKLVIYKAINHDTNRSCHFYEESNYLKKASIFRGECKDGFVEGNSSITHSNGHKYIGDFNNGYYNGYGKFIWDKKSYIEGEFHKNYLTGEGKSYLYGNIEKGNFYRNYFTGYGLLKLKNGRLFHIEKGKKELLKSSMYEEKASLSQDRNISLSYLKESLNIREEYLPNHPILINTYDNLVQTLLLKKNRDSLTEAKKYSLKALTIREKIYNKNSETVSTAYNNLALILVDLGEFKEGLNYFLKAIKIDEKEYLFDNPLLASLYSNIGLTYREIGELKKAKNYIFKSLKIREEISLENQENYENILIDYNTLGLIYQELGDLKKATKYIQKSLNMSKISLGENHPYVIEGYSNLSMIYLDNKEYDSAKKEAIKSLELAEKYFPKESYELSVIYNNISLLYKEINQLKLSIYYALKGLDISTNILSKNHPELGTTYANLSLIYMKLNSIKEAKEYAEKALEIRKKNYNKMALMMSYRDISFIYLELKKYNQAFNSFKKAFTLFLQLRNDLSLLNNRAKKETLLRDSIHIYNLLDMALLYQGEDIKQEVFNLWLQYKGEINSSKKLLPVLKTETKDKKLREKIEELIRIQKKYSEYFLNNISYPSKIFSSKVQEYKAKKETIEEYIGNKIDTYKKSLELKKINSAKIAKNLNPNELYIDFAKTDRSYYRFTLDSKNKITYTVFNAQPIDELIKKYRKSIIKQGEISLDKDISLNKKRVLLSPVDTQLKESASTLYNILFKDINSSYLSFIISTDGLLNRLPFEALYTTNKKYLIQEKTIKYISSGKAFLKAYNNNKNLNKSNEIIVFSNLDYDSTQPLEREDKKESDYKNLIDLVNKGVALTNLPYTKSESDFMKKLFNKNRVSSYTGKEGTKKVLESLDSPKILHLSTHSLFGEDNVSVEDSLLKSAIALSGYNAIIGSNSTQGIMTALEFSTLNLYNTDLVLFSSCQSGLGEILGAEGILGLSRGATLAGAKRVISTLWSVADKESIELTKRFYEQLKQNNMKEYAEALRKTKIEMIEQEMSPFFWAGFIEYGID